MSIDPSSLVPQAEEDRTPTGTNRELEQIEQGGESGRIPGENRRTGTNRELPEAVEQQGEERQ